jgi:hypothetical protein
MKDGATWHRVSFGVVTVRTDPEQPEARRWRWRNAGGQLRLISPRGRERLFRLGRPARGAWMSRVPPEPSAEPAENLEGRKAGKEPIE